MFLLCVCSSGGSECSFLCVFVAVYERDKKFIVVLLGKSLVKLAHTNRNTLISLDILNLLQIFRSRKGCFYLSLNQVVFTLLLFLSLFLFLKVDLFFQTLSSICSQTHSRRFFLYSASSSSYCTFNWCFANLSLFLFLCL